MDAVSDAVVVIVSPDAHTWTANTQPGTWQSASLPVAFRVATPRSRDLGADEDAELDVALRTWPGVSCTSYRTALGAETQAPPGDDGINAVYFHDDAWPSSLPQGVIAVTVVHVDGTGHYHDADIHMNGAAYTFSLDGRAGTVDARSIFTHELGHALGLGHSSDLRATMYATYMNDIAWRSLEQDDDDGVCSLYPGVGLTSGCEASACPLGFFCVGKTCERQGARGEVCSPCERVPHACDGAGDAARCIDLPSGGRVCGRACAADADCGAGFHCAPTTTAGDLQCVSDDECASGPDACHSAADCGGFACSAKGACVGPGDEADAGAVDAGDAGAIRPNVSAGGGCATSPGAGPGWIVTCALAALAIIGRKRWRSR